MKHDLPPRLERFAERLEHAARRDLGRHRRRVRLVSAAGAAVVAIGVGGVAALRVSDAVTGTANAAEIIRDTQANLDPQSGDRQNQILHRSYASRQWGARGESDFSMEYWQRGCAIRMIQHRPPTRTLVAGAGESWGPNGENSVYDPRTNTILRAPLEPRNAGLCSTWTEAEGIEDALARGDYEVRGEGRYEGRPTLVIGRKGEPDDHFTEIDAERRVPLRSVQPPGFYSAEGSEMRWPVWEYLAPKQANLDLLDLVAQYPRAQVRDVDAITFSTVRNELLGAG